MEMSGEIFKKIAIEGLLLFVAKGYSTCTFCRRLID